MRTHNGVVVRQATLAEIFQVRWDVLRPGRPIQAVQFPGDDRPETFHIGAFEGPLNIACASFMQFPWKEQPAWQLRGMGVVATWQGKRVGQYVLEEAEQIVRQTSPLRLLWCNAREEALKFYQRQGWVIASERFYVEDVGPHFKMTRELRDSTK